jgi:uncharacterized LabA/DUF88 family protein
MGRFALFVDGGYLRKVLRQFGEPRIDCRKLSDHFAGSDERLRTYYYDCAPYQSPAATQDEQDRKARFDSFIHALENVPRLQVRLGRLARRPKPDGSVDFEQKKVDVLLTVDLVRLACEKQIQRAVLIAGDSDFVPAIQVAKDAGTIVQLYHGVSPRPHDELLRCCDDRMVIDQKLIDAVRQ